MVTEVYSGELTVENNIPYGQIIATDVSEDEFMARYAAYFCEWVDGKVIKMSPVKKQHDVLDRYMAMLFEAYFSFRPVGVLRQAPFVLRLEVNGKIRRREPDLQIILHDNPNELTDTQMNAPADIVIEIVSEESTERDYGEKFKEYEGAGIPEYWILDTLRQQTRFHRLTENGVYAQILPDSDGIYTTPLLSGFQLDVQTLWRDPLPNFMEIGEMVKAMVSD